MSFLENSQSVTQAVIVSEVIIMSPFEVSTLNVRAKFYKLFGDFMKI